MSRLCIWYETVRRKKNKHARRVHCPLLLNFGGCRTKLRCTAVAKNFSALRRDFPLCQGIPRAAGSHSLGADGGGGGGGGGGDDAARAVLAEERMSARKYGIPKGQAELLGTVRDRKPGNKVSKTNFQGCPRGANGSRIPGPSRRDQSACVELRGSPG